MSIEDTITIVIISLLSCGLTRALIPVLTKKCLIDHPNERSSHIAPTPRGGGWAIAVPVLAVLIFKSATGAWPDISWAVVGSAIALAGISWLDDVRSLGVKTRLSVQLAAVVITVMVTASVLVGGMPMLPTIAVSIAIVLGWVWFINLYNFMDGIDGITSVQTIFICIGAAVVHWISGTEAIGSVALPLLIAGATAGFLVWNWSPAKIFMGDIGSVFLGFIVGWLLIELAFAGHWAAAIILPLYYLADATITLGRRVLRGDKFWEAHREHYYQRAHQAGLGHNDIVRRIALGNIILLCLAIWSVNGPSLFALAGAICVTGILLFELSKRPPAS